MPIKLSSLEKNLFYRVAKVFFLTFPLLAAVVLFLRGYINFNVVFQKDILDIIQKNIIYIIYVAIGVALYYLILKGIWRGFLYIAFGGLEDDTKNKAAGAVQSVQISQLSPGQGGSDVVAFLKESEKKRGEGIFWIILIILFIYIATYSATPQNGGGKGNTCVPTGCGKLWHSSCTNGCYSSLSDCRQTGSGCGGNVTCRQCP